MNFNHWYFLTPVLGFNQAYTETLLWNQFYFLYITIEILKCTFAYYVLILFSAINDASPRMVEPEPLKLSLQEERESFLPGRISVWSLHIFPTSLPNLPIPDFCQSTELIPLHNASCRENFDKVEIKNVSEHVRKRKGSKYNKN